MWVGDCSCEAMCYAEREHRVMVERAVQVIGYGCTQPLLL